MTYTFSYRFEQTEKDKRGATFLDARFNLWIDTPPTRRIAVETRRSPYGIKQFMKEGGYYAAGDDGHFYKIIDNGAIANKNRVDVRFSWPINPLSLSLKLRAVGAGRIERADILDLETLQDFLLAKNSLPPNFEGAK